MQPGHTDATVRRASDAAIQALSADFRGELIESGDERYDEARRSRNALRDALPALVARCAGIKDVIETVRVAREHSLSLAVRGGGHDIGGRAARDGALLIDLSLLGQVTVDPETRTACMGAGATLADVDRLTQHYALAAPTGTVSTIGIAGLTLGGGLGWLRRKHGMAVDNLHAVEIVTADARLRRASELENPELFWAVRGGGGNVGVVTKLELGLHRLGPEIVFLATLYPQVMAQAVLAGWRDWTRTAPEEASTDCVFLNVPASPLFPEAFHDRPAVLVAGMVCGPIEDAMPLIRPLCELGKPLLDLSRVMPYVAAQGLFDVFHPERLRRYWRSLHIDDLTGTGIAAIVARARQRPSRRSLVSLRHLGGALARTGDSETPIANRQARYLLSLESAWSAADDDERNITWTRETRNALQPFSTGGVHLAFESLAADERSPAEAAYGANHERLVALEARHDPRGLFRSARESYRRDTERRDTITHQRRRPT